MGGGGGGGCEGGKEAGEVGEREGGGAGGGGGAFIGGASERVPSLAAKLTLGQKDDWRWNFSARIRRSQDIQVRI